MDGVRLYEPLNRTSGESHTQEMEHQTEIGYVYRGFEPELGLRIISNYNHRRVTRE